MSILMVFFSTIVFLGPILSGSVSSWFLVWAGMELSFISFLPVMNYPKSSMSSESTIKYFLVQSCASAMILVSGSFLFIVEMTNMFYYSLFLTGLMLKLGLVPFHFWVIPVMKGCKFTDMIFILGPMKIIPFLLIILSIPISSNLLLIGIFMSLFSLVIGALLGNNSSSVRGMLAASSIVHSGWLLMGCLVGGMGLYFSIYLMQLYPFLLFCLLNQKFFMSVLMLSFSGLPPFMLFFGKLYILQNIIYKEVLVSLLFTFIIFSALISLNFYLKFSYSFYLSSMLNLKNKIFITNLMMISSLLGFILFIFFYGRAKH
uniref:NADH-ubiquinone oxidoreductase chain 2 n=1 Tax=Pupilla muscorum TaxID=225749 RepID=A0A0A6ZAD5_9EUPU|nr:NADH dehydrogenase subunit 2 [Pupilla muscorum]AGC52875.1 NADH dehydrogenase subunit 2 [Pupilla muscorum]